MSEPRRLTDMEIVDILQAGGCVLIMRHTSASPSAGAHASDSDNTGVEPRLDEQGRAAATAIGKSLKSLRIPITEVFCSPRSRAQETVRVAGLPTAVISLQLDEVPHGEGPAALGWLRTRVKEPPLAGGNVLIVTHMPNIIGDFGDELSRVEPGEVLVFSPDGSTHPNLLARIRPPRWQSLAGVAPSFMGPEL